MNSTTEEISDEPIEETASKNESVGQQVVNDLLELFGLEDLLNYSNVIRQVMFIAFLLGIGIFHIYNSHKAVRMVREANVLEKEIQELRWEQISIKSDLLKRSMQSDIEKDLEGMGFISLETPPYKIVIHKDEN